MSFKLKPTRNNPNPIEIKKEIEIIEVTTNGQYNNNYSNNNEKIKQLESENIILKSKIYDLNEIIQDQSNEITVLKLKLNKYETQSNDIMSNPFESDQQNNQLDKTIVKIEPDSINHCIFVPESSTHSDQNGDNKTFNFESNHDKSTWESDTDSDQSDYETHNITK
jgi:uncharacterized membrane protein